MSGAGGTPGGSGYGGRGGPPSGRSFEDRSVAKEQMMQTVRDSSQQDRRVYVGNLSYDVKWHHLKDFMRQGELRSHPFTGPFFPFETRLIWFYYSSYSRRSSLRRGLTTSEWNVEGGRQCVAMAGFFLVFSPWLLWTVGLTGWDMAVR
jgi:hypothetical protein